MPARINLDDVVQVLEDAGHHPAQYDSGHWDPGYRAVQRGPRWVLLFFEGPGNENEHLNAYQALLRDAGFHVHTQPMAQGSRHRLDVSRT